MTFDVDSQSLQCESCGHTIEIINDASKVTENPLTRDRLSGIRAQELTSSTMECKGCGAVIEVDAACTALECPYCGNVYVLAEEKDKTFPPDGVVPFKIDHEKVGEIFRAWLAGRKFAPNALKTLYESGKLQGMYLPFYTFDASVHVYYTAMGGRNRMVQQRMPNGQVRTVTHTDWYHTSGEFDESFDDILVRATIHMDIKLLDAVGPFGTQQAASWSPDYFAGYRAECFTRDLADGHAEARGVMEKRLISFAQSDVRSRFDVVKDVQLRSDYLRETYKYLMLPVYTTSYRFQDQIYQVIINGETGKIAGTYPKSAVKILLFVAVIVVVIILLVYLGTH